MLNSPVSKELPMYLPADVEAFAIVRGFADGRGPKTFMKKKGKYEGRQCFIAPIEFYVLDGEYAGMIDTFDIFIQVDNGEVYGDNALIQQLWDSAGITTGVIDGETTYPWPETEHEVQCAVDNDGEYELKNLGLKGRLVKFKTGDPRSREHEGKTYHNSNVVAFRTISAEDHAEMKPIVELYFAENPPF